MQQFHKACERSMNDDVFAETTFADLRLRMELSFGLESAGYGRMSKIQAQILPILLADPPQNMVIRSTSGYGKTFAMIVMMLNRVNTADRFPQIVCVTATIMSAAQLTAKILRIGVYMANLRVCNIMQGVQCKL